MREPITINNGGEIATIFVDYSSGEFEVPGIGDFALEWIEAEGTYDDTAWEVIEKASGEALATICKNIYSVKKGIEYFAFAHLEGIGRIHKSAYGAAAQVLFNIK